ncbi:MAG: hypothetical protein HC859_07435 [Bacteroidia bacterium]|nr:hypothetical protein [Bacteroidia bacterium]
MIYPNELETKLGFDQLRERIARYCLSPVAASRVLEIRFQSNPESIRTLLRQNLEFRQILEKSEDFPARHYHDPTEWLEKIRLEGSFLDERQFLDLANTLHTITACRKFLTTARETYPALFALAEPVDITTRHADDIVLRIDDNATVKDNASPELAAVRKKLKAEQQRLRRLADTLFRSAVESGWVPEGGLPTIRDGRVVIPVLAEHKRRLKGFILDESATGQTIFIEPAEMLDTNNEIRDLEHAEKREVIKILRQMTDQLRQHLPALLAAFDFLATVDLIRAKAKLSVDIDADMPVVEDAPCLVWYHARHPLLLLSLRGKRDVVPLEIELDEQEKMLLVSGPNAGGKSVCLKTVGLLQYMVQCGLLIPVSERSRVGIFEDIFLDIGDQQSIENDLSTYSSHLHNMSVFIRSASARSLVLMDELGSGTDPNFGGAIAQAVLDALLERSAGAW